MSLLPARTRADVRTGSMAWDKSNEETADLIGGDRRNDRRYGLQLDVKWKLIRRRRVLETGTGHTVDLSSGGLMFDAGRHPSGRAERGAVDHMAGPPAQCSALATRGFRPDRAHR